MIPIIWWGAGVEAEAELRRLEEEMVTGKRTKYFLWGHLNSNFSQSELCIKVQR